MFSSRLAIFGAAVAFLSLVSLHVLSAWLLSLMFAAFGLSELALAVGLQPLLAKRSGRVGVVIKPAMAKLFDKQATGEARVREFDVSRVVHSQLPSTRRVSCVPRFAPRGSGG
jgi:hypothetical protein